jgi:CBS domain-containing protein
MSSDISNIHVRDVRHLMVEHPTVIHIDKPFNDLLGLAMRNPHTRHVYVLDDNKRMVGVVRMHRIVEMIFPFSAIAMNSNDIVLSGIHALAVNSIRDVMNTAPFSVREDDYLSDVAEIMMAERINELPVIDSTMHIIGQINSYEMISKYLEAVQKASLPDRANEYGHLTGRLL